MATSKTRAMNGVAGCILASFGIPFSIIFGAPGGSGAHGRGLGGPGGSKWGALVLIVGALGSFWILRGGLWEALGAIWRPYGGPWPPLGIILDPFGGISAPLGTFCAS